MDAAGLEDLFGPVLKVSIRRMFGGHGIYADGLMFALQAGGTVYLKADGESEAAFRAAGSEPFVYEGAGRRIISVNYWRLPEEAFEDPDELRRWVGLARNAASRAAARKGAPGGRRRATATRRRAPQATSE